jgi:hypothetical protein
MPAQAEADMPVVLDDFAAGRHRPDGDVGFVELGHRPGLAFGGGRPKFERLVAQRLDGPQRLPSASFIASASANSTSDDTGTFARRQSAGGAIDPSPQKPR